jgi:hypothetical protein
MSALAKTQASQLAAMQAATNTIQQENPAGMGYLKLNKVGYWVFGEDELDLEEEALWIVNPDSFAMGYISWDKKTKVGEQMASIYGPQVDINKMPDTPTKWVRQVGMQLVCLNGEDEGEQVQYVANSYGGVKQFGILLKQVMEHMQSGKAGDKTVPVLELGSDSYDHAEWGKVYTPEFDIKKWIANTGFGAAVEEEEEEEEEEQKPPPRKRAVKPKRAAKKPVEEEVVDEVEEVDEQEEEEEEKPTRRRRRTRK